MSFSGRGKRNMTLLISKERLREIHEKSTRQRLPEAIESRSSGPTLKLSSLKLLAQFFEEYQPKAVLEFGSGLSTRFMLNHLGKDKDLLVVSVDHSAEYLQQTVDQ